MIFPLLRRHNFGLSCQFPDDLPPTNPGYAISLRMSWDPEEPDSFFLPDQDRYSGVYVLGVQGVGKSSLLENMISSDIAKSSVIVIDPHGDLIDHILAQIPEAKDTRGEEGIENILKRVYLFDMLDEAYPFGVNVFTGKKHQTSIEQAQAVDRVMHIFEVLWGDVLSQQNLPRYLRASTIALFANPGATLVDMYDFLLNDTLREKMLANVTDPTITQFWEYQYNSKTPSFRYREIAPLINRLESLFMGRSLIRNIIGQSVTTIDFRAAIENKEILLIKLPLKTLPQDARLIGTILISQIHAAIFSFANLPQDKRPGFSLFVDEFQHFATTDFSEMFTEGRKFGARVCVAHQYRKQLPDYLQSSTMTARTKVIFQTTPEDAREISRLFESQASETTLLPENIDPKPVEYLLTYGSDNPHVKTFIAVYLRPMRSQRRGGKIEITDYFAGYGTEFVANLFGYTTQRTKPTVADPEPYLNSYFYEAMSRQTVELPVPHAIVEGFSNCGKGFYKEFHSASKKAKDWLTSMDMRFPDGLIIQTSSQERRFAREPRNSEDQLFHFLFYLNETLYHLVCNPIGKRTPTAQSSAEIAQMLVSLPRRAAFIRSGEEIGTIFTSDTPDMLPASLFSKRVAFITAQTRQKYCRMQSEVEQEIRQQAEGIDQTGPEQEYKEEEPAAQQTLERQQPAQIPLSIDTMNALYAQMKGKVIDPGTAILASLGEHYVLTIRQWMRLFAWGSYPRATQYFKELREEGQIYRKDREGRGGQLVEGDWFFLLSRGANELMKRKQPAPLFRLEPNEAEKASGDTLFHTYLVNDLLIHLRLLEREQPEIVRIEQIDHERSMRRTYLAALADSKLYPDGFLRLLIPTANGLKRRYMFLELQHTTQRDEANWKAKCRKYLTLFEQEAILEKFFATRTPQVLVITIDSDYVLSHKKWTEEVLAAQGERGRAYSSRFIIGSFDTGISDMSVTPQQFFCDPRFFIPFNEASRSLFGT